MTPEVDQRLEEYLKPSRIAMVATIGRDGMPQLTPNWYHYANGVLTVSTTKERIKYKNLSRDNRMSVSIYTEPRAADYVVIRGNVTIADDDSIWPETRAIVERYVAPEGIEDRMRQLRTQNRVIISLAPEQVVFRTAITLPPQSG